jgi:nicotinamide mononucleotide transporter
MLAALATIQSPAHFLHPLNFMPSLSNINIWKRSDLWIGLLISSGFLLATWQKWLPFPLTEALGFLTGAACVYLVVKQNIWNFPVGIANNIFFLILFGQSRLYGDAGLQVVYLVLGLQGWYNWLYGGQDRSPLQIDRVSQQLLLWLSVAIIVTTGLLMQILQAVNGSAPFLDAFTTALSLAAQYLLNRKAIESWFLWIAVDVLYVYLYFTRNLHLTAVLYLIFIGFCIAGYLSWKKSLAPE